MVQKEKASLWRIKHLLTRLSGDNTWVPCETVETENDFALFLDGRERPQASLLGKTVERDGDQVSTGTLASEDNPNAPLASGSIPKDPELNSSKRISRTASTNDSIEMISPALATSEQNEAGDVVKHSEPQAVDTMLDESNEGSETRAEAMEIDNVPTSATRNVTDGQALPEETGSVDIMDDGVGDLEEPPPRRMRTRAQAQAASENTASSRARSNSPDSDEDMFISPYFLAPQSSHPDRDLGLPQHEADDIRRLLQLYIQKQEEVCRGVQKVYDGLMKADRYRKQVMKWAKAEGHVGVNRDMSDGEDWYDKEEWGLDEDLKKGQDEEEEDAATTAKKTRTRRQ
jgi:hypothetical protein